jgi:hypothetical protein
MKKFSFTAATTATEKRWKTQWSLTLDEMLQFFRTHTIRSQKDGDCIVAGTLVSTARTAPAVKEISTLIYDIDGKQSYEEAVKLINESGVFALVYTTYSHMSTKTVKKVDDYIRWSKNTKEAYPPTIESYTKFLAHLGITHLTNLVFNYDKEDPESVKKHLEQASDGSGFICYHDPIQKFRVVIPLETPITMLNLSISTKEAVDLYKGIYHGVGQGIGLAYDTSCEDPSRLHYTPAHNGSVPPRVTVCNATLIKNEEDGNLHLDEKTVTLLDFNKYPSVAKAKSNSSSSSSDSKKPQVYKDVKNNSIDLVSWEKKHKDFDVESLIRDKLPADKIYEPRSGDGFHIQCPFESNHSQSGGLGTYCVNGDSEDRPWTIFCSHNSCKSANHRRLDYLGEFINQGHILVSDLMITPDQRAAAEKMGVDVSIMGQVSLTRPDEEDTKEIQTKEQIQKKIEEAKVASKISRKEQILVTDAQRHADDVYADCLEELATDCSIAELKLVVSRLSNCKREISDYDIMEQIAVGLLGTKKVLAFLDAYRSVFPQKMTKWDQRESLAQLRKSKDPDRFEREFAVLLENNITGHALDRRLRDLAESALLREEEARDQYEEFQKNKWILLYEQSAASKLAAMNAKYAKVRIGSGWLFLDKEISRNENKVSLVTPQGLSLLYGNVSIVTKGSGARNAKGIGPQPLLKIWQQESNSIMEYEGVTFLPGIRGDDQAVRERKFNIWNKSKPFGVEPMAGDASPVLEHIKRSWCNNDIAAFNWVCTFLADIIQNPDEKKSTALVLTGAQGTGKSIITDYGMKRILDKSFGASSAKEGITGNFNANMVGKLLYVGEEILFSGDKKTMNVLKDRVSRSEIEIEPKGTDKYSIPSFTRFIFTSNNNHSLNLDPDDRRFTVLEVSPEFVNNRPYFNKLREWFDGDGCSIWLNWLLSFNPNSVGLEFKDLYECYNTRAKREQIAMSIEPGRAFFRDLLLDGEVGETKKVIWPFHEQSSMLVKTFRDSYEDYVDSKGGKYERNLLTKHFRDTTGQDMNDCIKVARVGTQTKRVIILPPRKSKILRGVERKLLTVKEQEAILEMEDVNPNQLEKEHAGD